jgi:predicted alpha/beta superfamily hydrolase
MNNLKCKFLIFLLPVFSLNHAQDCRNKIIIGERFILQSHILQQERTITVHLPGNYSPGKKYPVLYMLDGLAQFGIGVNFSGMSYVGTVPEMIVVAIDYQNRIKEYTPTYAKGFQDSGGSDQFVDFIEKELFPYIDSTYSTMPFRILSGHSLAGILVVYLLFSERNIFNAYIAMDPSLWWDNNYIINKIASFKEDKLSHRCLYVTSTRSNDEYIVPFDSTLNAKSIKELRYKYQNFEDETHADVVFVSLYYGLKYIFSDYAISDAQKDTITVGKNPEFIIDHYAIFSKQVGMEFPPPEHVIIRSGIRSLYDDKDYLNAIKIFNILKSYYPESSEIYKYLAEAYMQKGDKELALVNFKKSLKLNPLDDKIKDKIKELENSK